MSKRGAFKIIDVNVGNVAEAGFFCYMSKRKTEGYRLKLSWLKERFAEGMRIKMILNGGRAFIEYIPGEYAWRAVNATGYMFIHCIWVVGMSKGKGCGEALLKERFNDARKAGMRGVAMATSEGNWLVGKRFLERHGFVSVDQAPPSFNLMVKKFQADARSPSFTGHWEEKMKRLGRGLTIVRSDQCPYIEASVRFMQNSAEKLGIQSRTVELQSSREIREISPSAHGVFSAVYNGRLLTYHPMGGSAFAERLTAASNDVHSSGAASKL
jgi:hypothetical protein